MEDPSDRSCLNQSQQHVLETLSKPAHANRILPHDAHIQKASNNLASNAPSNGWGIVRTTAHLLEDIAPALNGQALSPHYYGFVTGGVTPAAQVAENLVSTYDQNVHVHLPETTIATELEDRALKLLLELLDFNVEEWPGRTFTTGATASNIIGLACGREFVVNNAIQCRSKESTSPRQETVGEDGLLVACRAADITDIQAWAGPAFTDRHAGLARQVFQNPNAAYLSSGIAGTGMIQSPLNIGLENSRRFRALPVYATLVSYGRIGYQDLLQRQIRFARRIACYIYHHQDFDLLPRSLKDEACINQKVYIIVLFRAKEDALNNTLVRKLNTSSQMYVSGTSWEGHQACRIAAANWQVDPERDVAHVQAVIEKVLADWRTEHS
ncbi:MAG: hypothetical protein Q9178_003119 [Gyalolechia marmorata]